MLPDARVHGDVERGRAILAPCVRDDSPFPSVSVAAPPLGTPMPPTALLVGRAMLSVERARRTASTSELTRAETFLGVAGRRPRTGVRGIKSLEGGHCSSLPPQET